jgi:hypothetical protein
MMDGQISVEDIMRLLEKEEDQAILQRLMAEGSTDPTSLIGDGSEPGDVFVDKSAQDYTGPLTDSELDVRSVETGVVPMAIEGSEAFPLIESIESIDIGARGLETPAERRFNNDLRRGKLEGSEAFELIESLGIGARGLETPAEREERMKKALTGRQ